MHTQSLPWKYKVVKVSSGGSYGVLALALESYGKSENFCVCNTWKCIQFNFFYHLVVFECPHQLTLSASLKLHSFSSKMTIHRSLPLPKILGQKAKSNQLSDSKEPPIIFYSLQNRSVLLFTLDFFLNRAEFSESVKSLKHESCFSHVSCWHCGSILLSYIRVGRFKSFYCNDKYFFTEFA